MSRSIFIFHFSLIKVRLYFMHISLTTQSLSTKVGGDKQSFHIDGPSLQVQHHRILREDNDCFKFPSRKMLFTCLKSTSLVQKMFNTYFYLRGLLSAEVVHTNLDFQWCLCQYHTLKTQKLPVLKYREFT